ncbi:glycosyltransferase family 39 protein [Nemorincola caseinilytica]|uniref:Glycosyltransferase family 39 protein n=2 Tax=Nemorincola caseinilytica TaxID=2054315 RepID=A0ABP8NGM0_9BACT
MFILIGLLYITSVSVDTMDVDASQYAEMCREMLQRGDLLHVYDRGADYLDKPPLLFWTGALSMRIFGINNLGYKMPSILFALWAVFATYRLGKSLYNEVTGRMAALILATCQGMFLMTNDVRCDTILMSCVVTSLWLIQEWADSRKLYYLLGGAAAIALGMMTKGPIALMVPVFCFGTHWALQRQWKNIFAPAHLLAIVVIAILLIPMSIGLYQQFDMQPHKVVNGSTCTSGLRFFYWSQSFGRITGESPWDNGAPFEFLLMNMLWSFLPWIFLFVTALVINCATLVRQRLRLLPGQEWVTTGGFLLAYLALGSSAYQLPHYIFVVFPLAAIMTAKLIADMMGGKYKRLHRIMRPAHIVITVLLLAATLAFIAYIFPAGGVVILSWALLVATWLSLAISKKTKAKLLFLPALGIIIVNIFFTNYFYVPLLKYQVGSQVGRYMHEKGIDPRQVAAYKVDDPINSIHFYAQGVVPGIDTLPQLQHRYILTSDRGMKDIEGHYSYTIDKQGVFYKVSELTGPFLDPRTRSKEVKNYYLLRLAEPHQ